MLIVFCSIWLVATISNAGDLKLNNLEYKVQLNEDGSADVVEKWNIWIEDTNTLFKTFKIDKTKYKQITNVTVAQISNDTRTEFIKINQEKYHVDKNCFYALISSKGKFEIAWGVQEEDIIRTYEISYKIIDAVKNYADCSEFYWQFIATDSEIPAKWITGTITLPNEVSNIEELRVWAHGPLNGNIKKVNNRTIAFEVEGLKAKTMLETRVVTPTTVFAKNQNVTGENKLEVIMTQEQKWADIANAEREAQQKRQEDLDKIFFISKKVFMILGVGLGILFIFKCIKYNKLLKELPVFKPEQEMKYFREIPDESYTPAQAAFLYYFKKGTMQVNMPKIVSATMLDLCMKGYLEFEVLANKKNTIKITLKENKDKMKLNGDERTVYELLEEVADKETNSFVMKDLQKYAEKTSGSFSLRTKFTQIEKEAMDREKENQTYDSVYVKKAETWNLKGVFFIFLTTISLFLMWVAFIPLVVACIYCFKIAGRYKTLTQKGVNEQEKWRGLDRYMKEFSLIKDKTVPELVLWENYLVYATVFGCADKVLEQLKVVYPQITDPNYCMTNGYTYMFLLYHTNMSTSFINSLNTSVNTTYMSANYSSGSGAGGGFSGGGGFGGGGGRNGRKITNRIKTYPF